MLYLDGFSLDSFAYCVFFELNVLKSFCCHIMGPLDGGCVIVEYFDGTFDKYMEDFEIFEEHLVVVERKNGLIQLRVRPWSGAKEHYIDFGEAAGDQFGFATSTAGAGRTGTKSHLGISLS